MSKKFDKGVAKVKKWFWYPFWFVAFSLIASVITGNGSAAAMSLVSGFFLIGLVSSVAFLIGYFSASEN